MVRLLLCVVSLGLLLLLASAAPAQVCTRYENGRTYILPGCRGAGEFDGVDLLNAEGTIGSRRHPFTGQRFCTEMSILSWNALMGLVDVDGFPAGLWYPSTVHAWTGLAMMQYWPRPTPTVLVPLEPCDPSDLPVGVPTIVEAPFTLKLKASFSQPLPSGSRISRIRITNKDLIERFKEQLGVSGRRARLVIRRHIADSVGQGAQLYLVLDGVDYLVEGFLEPLPFSLPEGFYGRASAHEPIQPDGTMSSSFHFQEVSAMVLGDLAEDGFTMGLFSLGEGWCRSFLPMQQDAGFLCRKFTSKVTGGMQMSELPLDSPMLVTGTLRIGRERVWSP